MELAREKWRSTTEKIHKNNNHSGRFNPRVWGVVIVYGVGFPGDHPFPRYLRLLFLTSGTCVSYCYPPVSSELRNYQKIVKANMDKSFQEQGPPQLFEKGLEKPSSY